MKKLFKVLNEKYSNSGISFKTFLSPYSAGIFFFIISLIFVAVLTHAPGQKFIKLIAEAVMLSFYVAIFAFHPGLKSFIIHCPLPHRFFFIAFFFSLIAGQLIQKGALTFPFSSWGLYSMEYRMGNWIPYYELVGIDKQGNTIPLKWEDTSLSTYYTYRLHQQLSILLNSYRITIKSPSIGYQRHTAPSISPFAIEKQKRKTDNLLFFWGTMFNQKHPHHSLSAVEVRFCTFDMWKFSSKPTIYKKVLWHVSLDKK